MAAITFITPTGQRIVVEAVDGSVMEAAFDNGVDGIDADCGGVCSCATCHVHVDPAWADRTGRATEDEKALLEFEAGVSEYSRLSCQIEVSDALDGLVVRVAER
jgi:2Fe-2S ferredoxin